VKDELLPEDEEPKRVLGFPVHENGVVRVEEPRRVLGFAVTPGRVPFGFHIERAAHPLRWIRWRLTVRRLGPHAPEYDDTGARRGCREKGKNPSSPPLRR
jgi:hypothetical protein